MAAGGGALGQAFAVEQQLLNSIGQGGSAVFFADHAGLVLLNHLGETGVVGRHDRHAAGHRLDHVQPERLAVRRRHAEYGQPPVKRQLRVAVEVRPESRLAEQSGIPEFLFLFRDECLVKRLAAAADRQLESRHLAGLLQADERVDERVESLLRAHAGEVAEHRRVVRQGAWLEAVEVDAVVNVLELGGGNRGARGHNVGVITGRRDEQVDVGDALAKLGPSVLALRAGQRVEKGVFTLEQADHRHAKLGAEPLGQAGDQGVREADDIRLLVLLEPSDELLEFAHLVARLAAHHRERQVADLRATSFAGEVAKPVEQPPGGEHAPEPVRRFFEAVELLREVDVQPAEEERRAFALIRLIQREREVQRNHQRMVAHPPELRHEGVVAETIPAIHAPGAGCDLDDIQAASCLDRSANPLSNSSKHAGCRSSRRFPRPRKQFGNLGGASSGYVPHHIRHSADRQRVASKATSQPHR